MTNKILYKKSDVSEFIEISPETSVKDALRLFKDDKQGIIFVCDKTQKLRGVLTDGDFRRAMARGLDIEAPCSQIMNQTPLLGTEDMTLSEVKEMIRANKKEAIFYLPIINKEGIIVDVISRSQLYSDQQLPVKAVIMAGGFGSRLGELTRYIPKPMLKISENKSLLEHIIEQMSSYGIKDIVISTHHMAEKISAHFGDGKDFNVSISYVHEEEPLGTAGALSLLEDKSKTLLVMNGDILTTVNFDSMWRYHKESKAGLTVACRQYDMSIPYGVIQTNEQGFVKEIQEKPNYSFRVSAGIYLIEPEIIRKIEKNKQKNMPDIITDCCNYNVKVSSFVIHEYWLDVGVPKDYKKAQEDYSKVFESK